MAKKGNQTFIKRQREMKKKEVRQEKLERRKIRSEEKKNLLANPPAEGNPSGELTTSNETESR